MPTAIKNINDLKKQVNIACGKAVKNAGNRLLGTLQQLIDTEFYDVFIPDFYIRTYQFWESATTEMLSQTCGQVFMDKSKMNYNSYWSAERQLLAANIGSHGGIITDETKEHKFWEAFIDFCEKYAVDILKEELIKQGLKIK